MVGVPEAISAGEPLDSLSWLTDSRTLQSVSARDGSVTHWNATSKCKLDVEPSLLADRAKSLLSPDRRLTATRSHAAITIRDAQTATIQSTLQPTANHLGWLSWSPDSSRLAIAIKPSRADTVGLEFWDVKQPRLLSCWTRRVLFEWDHVRSVSWLEDSTRVAAVAYGEPGDDGSIQWKSHLYVIDVATGAQIFKLVPPPTNIASVVWSPTGDSLALGTVGGQIQTIDANTGRTIISEKVHGGPVTCLAFLRDGTRLASAAQDKTVKVIDPMRGDELLTFTLSDDMATHLAWSPDGRRLSAATQNGQIRVWDASQGSEFSLHGSRQAELAQAYFRRGDSAARQEFLKVAPDNLGFWYTRGIAHAQLGQFDQAEEEFSKALLPRRLHIDFAWSHAWALLGAERLEAYRDACQLMAREYDRGKPNPNELHLAWLSSLVPNLEFHSELALRLVTQDFQQSLQEFDNSQLLSAAARLYRDGHLETAISVLTELSSRLERSSSSADLHFLACARYFLAMAHHQQGQASQAAADLAAARYYAARHLEANALRADWRSEIEFKMLDREAATLIGD